MKLRNNLLMGCTLVTVRSMADVTSEVNTVISSDRSRLGGKRLSLTKHLTSLSDDVFTFPAHTNDRSATEELA